MKFLILITLCFSLNNCQNYRICDRNKNLINSFAFDIYEKSIEGRQENVVISPFSIHSVLTMALLGATDQSETRSEMLNGLKFSQNASNSDIASDYEQFMNDLKRNDNLKIANKIYINRGFTVNPTFHELSSKSFKSTAESIDFSESDEASIKINQWIEYQTNNKIKDLISPGMLDSSTAMILVNTLHYEGYWEYEFETLNEDGDPYKLNFQISSNETVEVEGMYLKRKFRFAEFNELGFQVLRLPYKDQKMTMVIILPNEFEDLTELTNKVRKMGLKYILGKLKDDTDVIVYLPKFKFEFETDLNESLEKLGMKKVFTESAELGNLVENSDNLEIGQIFHKTIIEVNEKMTVATSITFSMIDFRSAQEEYYFYATHPFLFFLVSNVGDQIMLMGRVVKF